MLLNDGAVEFIPRNVANLRADGPRPSEYSVGGVRRLALDDLRIHLLHQPGRRIGSESRSILVVDHGRSHVNHRLRVYWIYHRARCLELTSSRSSEVDLRAAVTTLASVASLSAHESMAVSSCSQNRGGRHFMRLQLLTDPAFGHLHLKLDGYESAGEAFQLFNLDILR